MRTHLPQADLNTFYVNPWDMPKARNSLHEIVTSTHELYDSFIRKKWISSLPKKKFSKAVLELQWVWVKGANNSHENALFVNDTAMQKIITMVNTHVQDTFESSKDAHF